MEPEPSVDIAAKAGLSMQEFAEVVRQGIRQAIGVDPSPELVNDLMEAVALSIKAIATNAGSSQIEVLKQQIHERMQKHIEALTETATTMASSTAQKYGEEVYMGWLASSAVSLLVRAITPKIITAGTNALIDKLAQTMAVPLTPLSDADAIEMMVIPSTNLIESGAVLSSEGGAGYPIVDSDLSDSVVEEEIDFEEWYLISKSEDKDVALNSEGWLLVNKGDDRQPIGDEKAVSKSRSDDSEYFFPDADNESPEVKSDEAYGIGGASGEWDASSDEEELLQYAEDSDEPNQASEESDKYYSLEFDTEDQGKEEK